MAPSESLSVPLSQVDESTRKSSFTVLRKDVDNLHSCKAFQAIRSFLETRYHDRFCSQHQPTSEEHEETWLLQRDITYALILPVLAIHQYATQLAISMLGNRNIFDLELVFRGEARGAFSWLQCFFTEEKEWCSCRGCPACMVNYVLQAEPTLRIVLTACRLYELLRRASERPTHFPAFEFWVSSLRRTLAEDPYWGPGFWGDLEPRAISLENGINQMVRQCIEFENMKIPKGQSGNGVRKINNSFQVNSPTVGVTVSPTRLGIYKSDGKRLRFVSEESCWMHKVVLSCWMHKVVLSCWTTLLADAANVAPSDAEAFYEALRDSDP